MCLLESAVAGCRRDCAGRRPSRARRVRRRRVHCAPMLPIRRNILELPASRIRQVTLAGAGIEDLIPLWFGEGDDVTPAFIRDAAAEALHRGETFYTSNYGIAE